MTYWIAVALGGIATYLTRSLPLVVTTRGHAPDALRRYLDALPIAVIAALAGAGVAVPDTEVTHGAEVVAVVAAIAIARWRRNLLLAVIAGVVVVALLRAVGL